MGSDEERQQVVTDETGQFSFRNLAPGIYSLSVTRSGYVSQSYGERPGRLSRGGTPINLLPGQQMTDLQFLMVAGAVITGRVYDRYGDPLEKARVQVWQFLGERALPGTSVETNDLGEYRLFGLAPGNYVVSASPRDSGDAFRFMGRRRNAGAPAPAPASSEPREVGGQTYYPGALEAAHAQKLELAAGQELGGIDINIRPVRVYTVRGHVSIPEKTKPENVRLMLFGKESFGGAGGAASIGADGAFEIPNVPSGSYRLMGMAVDPEQGFGGGFSAQMEVTVGNSDVEGLQVNLGGGAEVSGKVRVEGKSEVPQGANIMLVSASGEGFEGGFAQAKEDGTFTMKNVASGTYMVNTMATMPGMGAGGHYLKEVRLGGQDVREALHVSGAVSGLDVVLATDGGTVSGRVLTEENLPATGAVVVLVGKEGKTWRLDAKFGTTDQNGRFQITAVRPGDYKVVALDEEDATASRFQQSELPKSVLEKAKSIRVDAKGQHSIEVQLTKPK